MTKHDDPYADWDAAYVLGALTPSERREYEQHLAGCAECARAVAALATGAGRRNGSRSAQAGRSEIPTTPPGAATDTHDGPAGGMLEPPDPETLRTVVAETERRHHRRRVRTVLVMAVAGVVIATVGMLLPSILSPSTGGEEAYRFAEVGSTSLSGEVRLVDEPWGTRIEADCRAAPGIDPDAAAAKADGSGTSRGAAGSAASNGASATTQDGTAGTTADRFALYIVSTSGTATRVATWRARAGGHAVPVGTVDLPRAEIADVEVRSITTGDVQLRRAFD